MNPFVCFLKGQFCFMKLFKFCKCLCDRIRMLVLRMMTIPIVLLILNWVSMQRMLKRAAQALPRTRSMQVVRLNLRLFLTWICLTRISPTGPFLPTLFHCQDWNARMMNRSPRNAERTAWGSYGIMLPRCWSCLFNFPSLLRQSQSTWAMHLGSMKNLIFYL